MKFTMNASVYQLLKHPVARDVTNALLRQTNKSPKQIYNPAIGVMRLAAAEALGTQFGATGAVTALLNLVNLSTDILIPPCGQLEKLWWRDAVIYQIYPRSFQDTNGDGIGDIPGIRSRLDYLKDLGVDAIWLSPIYASPQVDNGYDVQDYKAIDPQYGTMADVEGLIGDLHSRGMKLIMDLVFNHTSDQHAWFQSDLHDPNSPYHDFYIWRKGTPDAPPNNWTSFFGGSAWKYYPERGWNLHLFAPEQPDLNWENPNVREALYEITRFWRDKGVDGFRLDVINYISKVENLPNGNTALGSFLPSLGMEHYFYGPRLHEFLREFRAKGIGDAFTVGETAGFGREINRLTTSPSRLELSQVFSFDHLETPGHTRYSDYLYDLAEAKDIFVQWMNDVEGGIWDALFWENHDNPRMVSKVSSNPEWRTPLAKLLNLWLLSLRGTTYLYQGQELGLPNAIFSSIEELRDLESINVYHRLLPTVGAAAALRAVQCSSRDHARLPMPWTTAGGFTTGTPWIKLHQDTESLNVATQQADTESVWQFTKDAIALRHAHPALVFGTFKAEMPKDRSSFCFYRTLGEECLYIEMNLTAQTITPPKGPRDAQLTLCNYQDAKNLLRPYECRVWTL